MTALLLALALVTAPSLAAPDPLELAVTGASASPTNAFSQLRLGQALAREPDRRDEAVAILTPLLADRQHAYAAAEALAVLLLDSPPRRAWLAAVEGVLRQPDFANSQLIRAWRARALALDPAGLPAALAETGALLAQHPDDAEVIAARAEVLLRAGRAPEAAALVAGLEGLDTLTDLLAPIAVAAGRVDAARPVLGPEALGGCTGTSTTIPCAALVAKAGYPRAALAMLLAALEAEDLSAERRAALLVAASGYRSEPAEAIRDLRRAVALDPTSERARAALTRALLRAGDPEGARTAAGADPALQATVYAVQLVSPPGGRPSTEQIERALALAGDHPRVLAAAATHYAERRRWDRALAAAEALLAQDPADPEALALYLDVALAARQVERAIAAARAGLAVLEDPEDWAAAVDELAVLLAARAERRKEAGELDGAIADYLLATALSPATSYLWVGLGGALWDADKLEAAEGCFRRAAALPGADQEPALLLAELLYAQGRAGDARQALRAAGLGDDRARQLERQLAAHDQAREALDQGDPADAVEAWQALLAERPDDPRLHKELAEALTAQGLHDRAAAAYRRARELDPDDPWAVLGEVNALLSAGHIEAAEAAMVGFPATRRPKVLFERERTERRLLQARADALRAEGRLREAGAIYTAIIQDAPKATWALSGLAETYMSQGQYAAAQLYFEEAAAADPDNEQAWLGQVRALLARGELGRAASLLEQLAGEGYAAEQLEPLRAALELARIERRVAAAQQLGREDEALAILEQALRQHPEHPDLLAAWARLSASRDPEAAAATAEAVLRYQDPTHEGALGALLAATEAAGSPWRALPLLDAALVAPAGVGDWVAEARELVALQLAVHKSLELDRRGRHREAVEALAAIEAALPPVPGTDALQQVAGAWLVLGHPERALPLFQAAYGYDPADGGAAVGLAGALEGLGHPARAEELLAAHWERSRDLEVGAALAALQARRGHYERAARTAADVERYRLVVVEAPPREPAEPLPVPPPPSGRSPERDPPPAELRAVSQQELDALRRAATDPTPADGEAGLGWFWRPDAPGPGAELRAIYTPVGVELNPADPLRVTIEALPVRLSDGLDTQTGAALAAGLATPWVGAPVAARGAIGLSPVGFDYGTYLTGYGMVNLRPSLGFEARIEGGRAPATQSLLAWSGALDGDGQPFGRISDTWLAALLTLSKHTGSEAGMAAWLGSLDGLQLAAPVGWRQLAAWGRAPALRREGLDLAAGLNAQLLTHERWIGGAAPGQGGVFSPELYLAAAGLGEVNLALPPDAAALCAGAELGPQYVRGAGDGVSEGWRLGTRFSAAARMSLTEEWTALLGVARQSVWSGWQESTALAQVRYGARSSRAYSPGETTGSPVHGVAFQEPGACWDRVVE